MFTRLWVLGLFVAMATLAQDRTAAEPSSTAQTLQTLLSEVRQLRLALERSNLLGPRIQIAVSRIQLQQEQVARLNGQIERSRRNIADLQDKQSEVTDNGKRVETQLIEVQDLHERKALEFGLQQNKSTLERLKVLEQQERTREAELASALMNEQSRLVELNDRMASIERRIEDDLTTLK
jgi:hypothetical protein